MLNSRQCFKAAQIVLLFAWGLVAVSFIMPLTARLAGQGSARFNGGIRRTWCRAVCQVLGVKVEVNGQAAPEARLTVANHISWLDIIVLGSLQPLTFVAKLEVAEWPVLGYLARRTGTLFIKRGDTEQTSATCERMAWQLRQGKHLMLFPEGTTTRGERVLRFHGKLLQPAQRAQVPVQAVALQYLGEAANAAPFVGDDDFLPHLLNVLKLRRVDIRVHFCATLPVGLSQDALARTTRNQVIAALGEATAAASVHSTPLPNRNQNVTGL